ncbi:acetyl-CoA C-acetyltransferase [Acrasis kona]|uniref:Acetyl-CoA C-acetyltransferase n=1 Tax=Acrasis kona TaxID=1008807 RepID=A0AAW2YWF0_9EUKA
MNQPIKDDDVLLVSYVRTPVGKFNGSLSNKNATDLGALVIKNALSKVQGWMTLSDVGEVFMGNVLSSNLGQAPARQSALKAGLPESVPCTTVNKVCASGMKAIMMGAMSIMTKQRQVVVCGGMENMSQVPYYLPNMRNGKRLGDSTCVDGMIKDGLWDVYNNVHMGTAADKCSKDHSISREEQDAYAILSHSRSNENKKHIENEIAPVGEFKNDESVNVNNFDKLKKLKPVFGDSITAGNSSPLSDGASCVILCSGSFFLSKCKNLPADVFLIRAFDDAAVSPMQFTIAPSKVVPPLLKKLNLNVSDIDYWEINEAFAVVALANQKLLKIEPEKLNVFGGGVSFGHPIGSSGCRIVVTLCNILSQRNGRLGCAAICNGGGGASGLVVERLVRHQRSKMYFPHRVILEIRLVKLVL